MNIVVVVDHQGSIIYLDFWYIGLYPDVTILRTFELHKNQHYFFVHDDENFEYLLGDSSYLGEKTFILKRIGRCKINLNVDRDVINAYNKMHLKYKM
jgi:L-rhamnose isomerase